MTKRKSIVSATLAWKTLGKDLYKMSYFFIKIYSFKKGLKIYQTTSKGLFQIAYLKQLMFFVKVFINLCGVKKKDL